LELAIVEVAWTAACIWLAIVVLARRAGTILEASRPAFFEWTRPTLLEWTRPTVGFKLTWPTLLERALLEVLLTTAARSA
jgi:hypothetical protein